MDIDYSVLIGRTIIAIDSVYGSPVLFLDDGKQVCFNKTDGWTNDESGTHWPGEWTLELVAATGQPDRDLLDRNGWWQWQNAAGSHPKRERGRRKRTSVAEWIEMGRPTS